MSKNNLQIITLNEPKIRNFATSRNLLLKKSKSDWVFFVDSDETVSDELKSEIFKLIGDGNGQLGRFNGYYVKRENYFLGKYIGTDKIIRLGLKNSGQWERSVHEVWKIKGDVGQLRNSLIHKTAKSLGEYISKINFYAKLHIDANKLEGKRSSVFKIVFFPPAKFIQSLLMGRGVVFSIMQAFHSFLSWSELWLETEKTRSKNNIL